MTNCGARIRNHVHHAGKWLSEPSARQIAAFVAAARNPDGGFRGRTSESDLYYTLFALHCLDALPVSTPLTDTAPFCAAFETGTGLDFVHVACLVRCQAFLRAAGCPQPLLPDTLARLETYRARDGGYARTQDAEHGTPYECFLAFLTYADAGVRVSAIPDLVRCVSRYGTADGAFANSRVLAEGTTPVTAAAAVLLDQAGASDQARTTAPWLMARCSSRAGFAATSTATAPDLLSTATALHALDVLDVDTRGIAADCIGFVEDLWHSSGGFCGYAEDDEPDCEYTFYALLALGCLV